LKKKGRIGSSFDDFLKQEGIYEEVTARAIKRVIAGQLDALMEDQGLTKSELAKRMKTSRAQLDPARPRQRVGDARHPHPRRSRCRSPVEDGVGVAEKASGLLDRPPELVIGPAKGRTRWRTMTGERTMGLRKLAERNHLLTKVLRPWL
jgi:hypothetical protein